MAKLLSKEEIQKIAAYIKERHKEATADASINISGNLTRTNANSTVSIPSSFPNPKGTAKAEYDKGIASLTKMPSLNTKTPSFTGGTPRGPKLA